MNLNNNFRRESISEVTYGVKGVICGVILTLGLKTSNYSQ